MNVEVELNETVFVVAQRKFVQDLSMKQLRHFHQQINYLVNAAECHGSNAAPIIKMESATVFNNQNSSIRIISMQKAKDALNREGNGIRFLIRAIFFNI